MNRAACFRLCSRVFVGVYSRLPLFGELRSSVAVIHRGGGEFLLQRRSDNLGWAFPGGVAWVWESPEQTLRREVFEETGLRIHTERRLLSYSDRHFIPSRITAFAAAASGIPRGSWEGGVEWIGLRQLTGGDTARAGLFPPHLPILEFIDRHPSLPLSS